jgi:hypothetical protein
METRFLRTLAIGLVLVGLLGGCATTATRADLGGVPSAENPEYLTHPLRIIGAEAHFWGYVVQYLVAEPIWFLLTPVPDLVGLSLEEQRYLAERKDAWRHPFGGERRLVQ